MIKYILSLIFFIFILSNNIMAKNVKYKLIIEENSQTINNKTVTNYTVNGTSVAPTIIANMGDNLIIEVVNKTNIKTTIHSHGVLLPNKYDGVGDINSIYIEPDSTVTYEYEVKQTGTYWYHAHGIEEAQGIHGAIVFNDPNAEEIKDDYPLIFTGKINDDIHKVYANLTHKAYNAHADMSMDNIADMNMPATHMQDKQSTHTQHLAENKAIKSKDQKGKMLHYSDVSSDEHYINNNTSIYNIDNISSKKVKLRLINAYSDGYLNFVYSGGDIEVIATDGINIKPIKVKNLTVAMGETYDVLVNASTDNAYELVAFFLGTKDYSKVVIGNKPLITLKSYNYAKYPTSSPYKKIISLKPAFINLHENIPAKRTIKLQLTGNHSKYKWMFTSNKKAINSLDIKAGDKVRIQIANNTMMPHPIHLHGAFFTVKKYNNMIKHTVNIKRMETLTLEFIADEEGKWLLHCHNLFHMLSGMMITINIQK